MTKISIIMPCYNEEKFIANAIESLVDEYVRENAEILVVDGGSKDNTITVVEKLIRKGYPIGLLKNERQLQCHGLNLGISEARGAVIVRVDAHSTYPQGYVKRLVELLETTEAANVGGVMLPRGRTPVQRAIALAMQHPVGVGDAKFHLGNFKGYVDTVYLGTFKKDIFAAVGLYDTNAHPNEDAELNIRILKAGQKIYLDSSIQVDYFPRNSFKKLALQYFRYGMGRAYTTKKHKLLTSYRQLGPPLLVICLLASLILSVFNPLFLVFWGCYIFALLAACLAAWPGGKISIKSRLLMSAAFMIMHITWGLGFLSFFFATKPRRH